MNLVNRQIEILPLIRRQPGVTSNQFKQFLFGVTLKSIGSHLGVMMRRHHSLNIAGMNNQAS
jgi:hypothetical protein